MRTRSQQQSPGGFISLENEKTTRRTRSTRGASQSNAEAEAEAEPSATAQTTTRSKPQRTAKKPAPKKTSTTKTQRRVTKRTTLRDNHTTDEAATGDEEPESHNDQPTKNAPAPNKDAETTHNPKDLEHPPSSSKSALSEPNTSERESPTPSPKDSMVPPDPLDSHNPGENERDPTSVALPPPPSLSPIIGTAWPQYLEEFSDIGSELSERSRTPSYDGSESTLDPDLGFVVDEEIMAQLNELLDSLLPYDPDTPVEEEPSTSEFAEVEPTLAEIEAAAEIAIKALEPTPTGTSCCSDPPATGPVEEPVVVDEEVEDLVEILGKLTLACFPTTVLSSAVLPAEPMGRPETQQPAETVMVDAIEPEPIRAAVVPGVSAGTTYLGSIYDDTPPQFLGEAWRRPIPPPVVVPQTLSEIIGAIPSGPSSIFDDERQAADYLSHARGPSISEETLVSEALVEESDLTAGLPVHPAEAKPCAQLRSSTARAPGLWPRGGPTRLSPIREESEMSPGPSSCAGSKKKADLITSTPVPAPALPPVPMVGRESGSTAPSRPKKGKKEKPLTAPKVNRKRSRTDAGNADRAAPETPLANKRRNLGPPGSTPFARRRTPLSRRLSSRAAPYSERLRRRAVESEGRIHRTVFRIPQLIAQNEADRRASETPSPSPFPEEPETTFDFTVERVEESESSQPEPSEPSEPQQPSAPETPRRGWNIRGLLSSVPRSLSISRFFGSSSSATENTEAAQPASERINRTQPPAAESSTRTESRPGRRRLSESHLTQEPPTKRARNLSYSLFPAPIDRSLYLGDIPKAPKAASKPSSEAESQDAQKDVAAKPKPQEATSSDDRAKSARGRESVTPKAAESAQKKRKRSPSPDVIPNPAGSSYGMDLDYFCYSSDSEDETNDQSPQSDGQASAKLPPAQRAVRSAIRSERHPSKKVRFDASPEDTPSKLRARSTDPYRGKHFIGMGDGSPSSTSASASAPATPTPGGRAPGFVPNRQGTFQLDYDDLSEDSESSGAPSPSTFPAPSPTPSDSPSVSSTQVEVGDKVPEFQQLAPLTPRLPTAAPPTPATNKEALQRARSQAEKYKPKTPSGLRATSRYSSPMVATPDAVVEQPQAAEKFGDDQFARDAQWLYENCPSGDLRQLSWPAKQSLTDNLGTSAASLEIMNDVLKDADIEEGYKIFRQGLQEFERASA